MVSSSFRRTSEGPEPGQLVQWFYLNPATDDLWEFTEHHDVSRRGTWVAHLQVRYVPAEWEDDGPPLTGQGAQSPYRPCILNGQGFDRAAGRAIPPALRLTGEAPAEALRALRVELYRRAMSFVHAHDVRGDRQGHPREAGAGEAWRSPGR